MSAAQQPQPMTGGGVALRREHSNSTKGLKLGLSLLWLHHKGKSAALAPFSAADAEHGPTKEITAAQEPLSARSGSEELIQPGVDGVLGASLSRSRSVSHSVARSRHQRTSSLTLNSSSQAAYPTIVMKSAVAGGSIRGKMTTTSSNNARDTMIDQTSGQAQFHVLPIAPAAFERRRKSVATAPTNYASGTKTSPTPSLSARKSAASLERIQPKSDDEIGGIYGWSEEEAARANEEYIRFMKAKGATLA
ncbi:hypothetical protein BJ741DRAFT_605264 [Chytriomyces cf. hyalinus JEL632]|nr:hypothetical protein BJ741DRAFT_605264 [Chytriomyces cf. hyalinus JEL632]